MPARSALLVVALVLILGTAARAQTSVPQSTDALRDSISAVLDSTNTPGAGVVLFSADSIRWTGYLGLADRAADRPVTDETVFRAGSVSKSVVSATALQLVETDALDLRTPVRDLAPEIELRNPWAETDPVRVVHLLEHTAGFDDLHIHEYVSRSPEITLREGLAINPAPRTVRWRPGQFYSYSNAGPPVAAYIFQQRTGRRFEALVADRIFEPLGMTASSFRRDERVVPHLATGYAADGTTTKPYVHIGLRPSGALNARPVDLARFGQMLLGRGTRGDTTLLDSASVHRMETPRTSLAARLGVPTGYGLGNATSLHDGFVYHGHGGAIDGFVARYGYLPAHDRGYVVMLNSQDGGAMEQIANVVRDYQTRSLTPPEPPPVARVPADTLARHTGYYVSFTPRNEIAHFVERLVGIVQVDTTGTGRLSVASALGGRPDTLLPVDAARFRGPSAPVATAVFARSPDGDRVLTGSGASVSGNLRAVSTASVWGRWGVAGLSLLLFVSPLLFALYWLPAKALGRLKNRESIQLRLWPLGALLTLGGAFVLLALALEAPISRLGTPTVYSIGYAALTLAYGLTTLGGLWALVRTRTTAYGPSWTYHLFVVGADLLILVYLAVHGLIGHRFWT
ncbi:MAG: serine hydrolase domain-containing protein [Salinibacter sp.]